MPSQTRALLKISAEDEMWKGEHPIIRVDDLSVSFHGSPVTHNISLRLFPGRLTALVGESGSGKSVTSMVLPRLDPPTARVSGSAVYQSAISHEHATAQTTKTDQQPHISSDSSKSSGSNTTHSSDQSSDSIDLLSPNAPVRTIRGGLIGTVFQEPMAVFDPLPTIGHQIEEALEFHTPGRSLSRAEKKQKVLDQLREVGLPDPQRIWASRPHELSGGQLQRAMIAMAIINRPRVLIADEPTTALDVTTQKGILALLTRLAHRRQLAILLITHDMGVVWESADYVYVMQHGRIVEQGPTRQLFEHPQQAYTRELLAAVPRLTIPATTPVTTSATIPVTASTEHASAHAHVSRETMAEKTESEKTSALVEVSHVSFTYPCHGLFHRSSRGSGPALTDISFRIDAGKTLALVGESGAGKTTLAQILSAQLHPQSGSVLINGQNIEHLKGSALRQARSHIGYVFQNSASALVPTRTVGWSIAEPLTIHTNLNSSAIRDRVTALMKDVGLNPALASRYPSQLSGGQQQRVGIARALALHPRLLIADEPTSSLDVTAQKRVLDLFHRLQNEYSYACLFITHDLGIVQEIADDVAVILHGTIMEQGPVDSVLAHPHADYTRTLLDASPHIGVLPQPPHTSHSSHASADDERE
jgi:peptide/nickel transport system ATP-binding protein